MSSEVAEAVAAMILERQTTRAAEHASRRQLADGLRAAFTRRRAAGLRRRHADKLDRNPDRPRLV